MKYKTTKREVMNGYATVICVGYCNLQTLLKYENEAAYTARREGWAADIYDFGPVAIVTGYAPFGNIRPAWDLCRKYEKAAEQIAYNNHLTYEAQKAQLSALIKEFIQEAKNNVKNT